MNMWKHKDMVFNCDRLWKLWYSVLVIIIQILIISLGISNYMTYRSQAFNPRYGGAWLMYPLNFQLLAIILSISLMVFLLYSCIFKVGNIANDGIELGIDLQSIRKALDELSSNKGFKLFISRFSTHLLPYSCLIHVIIALLMLLPVPLMQAEQIRNEVISRKWIWQSDVDYLVNPIAPIISKSSKQQIISPPPDPLCYPSQQCIYPTTPPSIQPEFVNLIIALLIITIRIATPFWYTNKAFSIIYSIFTFITSLSIIMDYESIQIFIKIYHNQAIDELEDINHMITSWSILIIFLLKTLLILFKLLVIFEYGYTQYLSNMRNYRQYFNYDMSDSVSQQSLNNTVSAPTINCLRNTPRLLGIILLACIEIINFPILLTCIKVQTISKYQLPVIWLNILGSALFFIFSLFFWFGLCVKNKWRFHINISTTLKGPVGPIGAGGSQIDSPEPVYGCFYNPPPSITSSITKQQQSGQFTKLRTSLDGSESMLSGTHRNYVYMHAASPIHERMINSTHTGIGAAGSDVSYGSNTKSYESFDIGNNRYATTHKTGMMNMPRYVEMAPYSTLASIKAGGAGGLILSNNSQLPKSSAYSDTSQSSADGGGSGLQTSRNNNNNNRRGSNRVTFKEEHNTITTAEQQQQQTIDMYNHRPDLLGAISPHNNNNNQSSAFFSTIPSTPHTDDDDDDDEDDGMMIRNKFDPDLEMSTDMRQNTITTTNNDNNNTNTLDSDNNKDPRMCSQV